MLTTNPVRASEAELVLEPVKFVGGTTAVTKIYGNGVTVTYVSTGVVDIKFNESQGLFLGLLGYCFEATTQSGVKGYTVVGGVIGTTSTPTLRINIYTGGTTPTLADLAASQWLTLTFGFRRTSVTV